MSVPTCPTCKRPYRVLEPHERARSGQYPGVEHEAARLNEQPTGACAKVLATLEFAYGRTWWDADFSQMRSGGWVSSEELRDALNGGDGSRRARQLRDEFGYPIEVQMNRYPGRRQAWYRLTGPRIVAAPSLEES